MSDAPHRTNDHTTIYNTLIELRTTAYNASCIMPLVVHEIRPSWHHIVLESESASKTTYIVEISL